MKEGLIASSYECPKCNERMGFYERKSVVLDGFEWRCRKEGVNTHDVCRSIRKNTWFSNIIGWFMFCREVCMNAVVNDSVKIGGVNVIVEIDESKFGKMTYGKGKPGDGKWVFGGIERGTNRCFLRVVERRTKEELLCVIKEWVRPGNTIISDCWKAYKCFSDEGFKHLEVNHSVCFKDPDTGAHTNLIEGTWSAIKRCLRNHTSHAEGMFDHYLAEYIWRRSRDHSLSDETFKDFLKSVVTL
ncbi:mitotic-spindle organizing protein 2A [Trichonephila clavipes]|nr:mitotic-spindle organizing protein 2A [Trichonephila clavipes]